MSRISGRVGRLLVVGLLLLATIAFGIGIAIEKAEEGEHSEPTAAVHSEAGEEAGDDAEAAPAETEQETAHEEETLLGIDAESTPLIVVGIVASLLAAAAVWWFGDRRWVLGLVALFCLGFAVLDGIEVGRKWGDETTIAVLALLALLLHAAAAAVAAAMAQRFTNVDPAPAR